MSTDTSASLDDAVDVGSTQAAGAISDPSAGGRDAHQIWTILKLRRRLIAAITAGTVIATMVLLVLLPAKYAATAVLLVDPRQPKVTNSEAVLSGIGADAAAVESQVELIESADLSKRVIAQLDLSNDPEFAGSSTIDRVAGVLSFALGRQSQTDTELEGNRVLERFRKGLDVRRRGLTYILEVTYQSTEPVKAARIANAVAAAYLDDQRAERTEVTVHASEWLKTRIAEMREHVRDSEHAVAELKAANNIFDVTQGNKLIDRQVEDLERQLTIARARTADAQARIEQVEKARERTEDPATLNEALRSPVIADLRSQYAQAGRAEAEYAAVLGPRHPTLASVRAQLADLRRQIDNEIARILVGVRNDYQVASGLEMKLEAQLTGLKEQSAKFKQAEVRLHELEREADANRALFEQFLARAKATGEQRSLQIADARVVSAALTPIRPNRPPGILLLGLAAVCGIVLGVGAMLIAEHLRRGFRSSDEIERALSLPSFGVLPRLEIADGVGRRFFRASVARLGRGDPASSAAATADPSEEAAAAYAQNLRSIRMRLRRSIPAYRNEILAVLSALPGEGKSTFARRFALAAASAGVRTLLVDGDTCNPSISKCFDAKRPSFVEVMRGTGSIRDSVIKDIDSGLHVLGAVDLSDVPAHMEGPIETRLAAFLAETRHQYDLVIIDTPAILPSAGSATFLECADRGLLVVEWERTDRRAAAEALRLLGNDAAKVAGVILSKVALDWYRYHERDRYGAATTSGQYLRPNPVV